VLNSDDTRFGGGGMTNPDRKAAKKESHGLDESITFRLAPLAVQVFEGVDLPKKKVAGKEKAQEEREVTVPKPKGQKVKGKRAK
jgi:uncharacterized protein YpmB